MNRGETKCSWYYFEDGDGQGWWVVEAGLTNVVWFSIEEEAAKMVDSLNDEEVPD